jgi:hypothetical protein
VDWLAEVKVLENLAVSNTTQRNNLHHSEDIKSQINMQLIRLNTKEL